MAAPKCCLGGVTSAVVLFHHPCIDGIFAALAAYSYFKQRHVPCRFVPHRVYEDINPLQLDVSKEDSLFLCDYIGPSPAFALELCQRACSVTILDHHKSAVDAFALLSAEQLPSNLSVNLDLAKSGCTMALDHFQPLELSADQRQLFLFAEDADLWRWQLPSSREFHAGMTALPKAEYDFDAGKDQTIFRQLLDLIPDQLIAQGALVLGNQQKTIAEVLQHSFTILLGGMGSQWGRCLAVRADGAQDLRSHIGAALAVKSRDAGLRTMAAVAYIETAMEDATKVKVSLRSFGEDEDTTVITVAMGGGGHRNAGSFILDLDVFDSWRTIKN